MTPQLPYLFVILQVLAGALCTEDGPIVQTNQGALQGTVWVTKKGREFRAFLGIPFAKPPVGELRFAAPVPGDPWDGVRDGTVPHAVCPGRDIYRRSPDIDGEEDCLYLNVYTPQVKNAVEPLPVMVFFHGGGWLCGGGNSLWYAPHILLDRDVVLVVTNYRLGALGFLSTGDDSCPGNNGLKDQNLALKWVQKNIERFGGDSKKVTLFGESAGGASVHYHMLSKMSAGLFNAGISQSGTALSIWSLAPGDEGVRNSKKLAQKFNCPTQNTQEMVECLRKVDSIAIVEQDGLFMEWDLDPMIPFKPTVEPNVKGAFLTKHPIDIINSGDFSQVPWIVGLNSQDGALRAAAIFGNSHLLEEVNQDFDTTMPISLMYKPTAKASDISRITKAIRKFYFNNEQLDQSHASREALVNLYTDAWFLAGSDDAVRRHKKVTNQPIYYYLFGHRGVSSFSEIFGDSTRDYGVCHADELQYLFPVGDALFPNKMPSEHDRRVRDIMTSLWSNFATYFNPTPELNELITDEWKPVNSDDKLEYYYISADHTKMKKGLFSKRADFWNSLNYRAQFPSLPKDEL